MSAEEKTHGKMQWALDAIGDLLGRPVELADQPHNNLTRKQARELREVQLGEKRLRDDGHLSPPTMGNVISKVEDLPIVGVDQRDEAAIEYLKTHTTTTYNGFKKGRRAPDGILYAAWVSAKMYVDYFIGKKNTPRVRANTVRNYA